MSDFSTGGPPVAGRFEGMPRREEPAEPPAPEPPTPSTPNRGRRGRVLLENKVE